MLVTVRDRAVAALALAGRPPVDTAHVSEGTVPYDCCGRLVVELQSLSATPDPVSACGLVEATVAVHLLRCAAGTDAVPSPAAIEAVGLGLAADADALLRLASDCDVEILASEVTFPRSVGGACAPVVASYLVRS